MLKPKECPKCGASSYEISNVAEMCEALGVTRESQTDKDWMCESCINFFNCEDSELTSWYKDKDFSSMTFSEISDVIFADWDDISQSAVPYVNAMQNIKDVNDMVGNDTADSIIVYFLSNANNWETDTALKVKKVLESRIA